MDYCLKRQERLFAEAAALRQSISNLPEGRFFCVKNGKYVKWFYYRDGKELYIPKNKRELAQKLVYRRFLEDRLAEVEREQHAWESYAALTQTNLTSAEEKWYEGPAAELLQSMHRPLSEELEIWLSEDYEANEMYPEKLRHRSASGHVLRSKSEAMIDTELFRRGIPFRYECALRLSDSTVYPDFLLRHPESGRLAVWEHFGMMDSVSYADSAARKLQAYIRAGYLPSYNFLMTFETQEHPLQPDDVAELIEHFLADP